MPSPMLQTAQSGLGHAAVCAATTGCMRGLWVFRDKQKQQADRNLSLAPLYDAQSHCLRYAGSTQSTADNRDARHCLCDEPSHDNFAEGDIEIGNVCTSDATRQHTTRQ